MPLPQYISAVCLIDSAVVSTFVFKKDTNSDESSVQSSLGQLRGITEYLIGQFDPPVVLAHIQYSRNGQRVLFALPQALVSEHETGLLPAMLVEMRSDQYDSGCLTC